MSFIKKLFSLVLVLVLIFSLGIMSYAVPGVSISSNMTLVDTNLDDVYLVVDLTDDIFVDDSLLVGSFTLNNEPAGLTVESVDYVSTTRVLVYLAYSGDELESNIENFNITIAAVELTGASPLTSNNMIISISVLSSGIVDELISMITQLLGLFTTFPLNVLVIGMLGSIGFGWFRKAKRAAQ